MKAGKVVLPKIKRPDEVGQIENENDCPYHRLISHSIEDCWAFKDWLLNELTAGRIIIT